MRERVLTLGDMTPPHPRKPEPLGSEWPADPTRVTEVQGGWPSAGGCRVRVDADAPLAPRRAPQEAQRERVGQACFEARDTGQVDSCAGRRGQPGRFPEGELGRPCEAHAALPPPAGQARNYQGVPRPGSEPGPARALQPGSVSYPERKRTEVTWVTPLPHTRPSRALRSSRRCSVTTLRARMSARSGSPSPGPT